MNDELKEEIVSYMNEEYAAVTVGGKFVIAHEYTDHIMGYRNIEFMEEKDFRSFWYFQRVPDTGRKQEPTDIGSIWLNHPNRRTYQHIIFSPGRDIEGCFNLWRGFAVMPQEGDWSLFQNHIRDNIAGGNENHFRWLMAWMARLVQDPGGEKPGTAIAMRGKQGTGKTLFGNVIGNIFGSHYLHITHQTHITGRFNSHFKSCMLALVDEAFWAGDKKAEGPLKSLITDELIMYEEKYIPVFKLNNYTHFIFASNRDWFVPSDMDDRRFFVIEVSDQHKEDFDYFNAIMRQMEQDDGLAAMLYDLLHFDYSGINLRETPKTAFLLEQKLFKAEPHEIFLYERLQEGTPIPVSRTWEAYRDRAKWATEELITGYQRRWQENVVSEILWVEYQMFCAEANKRPYQAKNHFVRALKRMCPQIIPGDKNRRIILGTNDTAPQLGMPTLSRCRQAFEDYWHISIPWDTPEDIDYGADEIDRMSIGEMRDICRREGWKISKRWTEQEIKDFIRRRIRG